LFVLLVVHQRPSYIRITPRILKGYYERNPRITPRILKGYYEHTPRITPRILKGYDERVQG